MAAWEQRQHFRARETQRARFNSSVGDPKPVVFNWGEILSPQGTRVSV